MPVPRSLRLTALLTLSALGLAACGAADDGTAASSGSTTAADASSLAQVCGDTVDVQLPWWPGVDYAFLFQLIGSGGTVDTDDNTYSGEIADTGVTLTLRSGGPAAGYQTGQSLAYQDDSIDLIVEAEDSQINTAEDQPTVSVFNYYDTYPLIFLWGNEDWDFQSLADIKESGETILAYTSGAYITALSANGDIDIDQVDGSFDGSPSRFVAAECNLIQQDYITTAPYLFEHETDNWDKPIQYLSLNSVYPIYGTTLQVRQDKLESYSPCLEQLVPLVQQAAVDYAVDPGPTNDVLVDYTSQLTGISVVLSNDLLDSANAAQLKYGLVQNGSDGTFGSFDLDKVQEAIDLLVPALTEAGVSVPTDLTPDDLATNEFLDTSISLPDDIEIPANDLPDDVPGL